MRISGGGIKSLTEGDVLCGLSLLDFAAIRDNQVPCRKYGANCTMDERCYRMYDRRNQAGDVCSVNNERDQTFSCNRFHRSSDMRNPKRIRATNDHTVDFSVKVKWKYPTLQHLRLSVAGKESLQQSLSPGSPIRAIRDPDQGPTVESGLRTSAVTLLRSLTMRLTFRA